MKNQDQGIDRARDKAEGQMQRGELHEKNAGHKKAQDKSNVNQDEDNLGNHAEQDKQDKNVRGDDKDSDELHDKLKDRNKVPSSEDFIPREDREKLKQKGYKPHGPGHDLMVENIDNAVKQNQENKSDPQKR